MRIKRLIIAALTLLVTGYGRELVADEPTTVIPDAVAAAFNKANRNGDQSLSVDEFIVGRGDVNVAKRDFKLYDFDGDGTLALDEFACVRGEMRIDQPGVLPDFLTGYVDQSVAAIDKSFGNWDQDPEREINAAQFVSAFVRELQVGGQNTIQANLREVDPNQDQKVSRTESRRFVEIQLGIRRFDGKPLRFPNGNVANQHLWFHIDADKNDVLDRTEYRERSYAADKWEEEFTKANIDGDEVVSFDEFCRLPWRGFSDPVIDFRTMDKNLDAQLDPRELLAGTPDWKLKLAENVFPAFDLDQDGVLSLVEYRLTPQSNMILPWTSVLTDDGDEVLTFPEFKFGEVPNPFQYPLLRLLYFHRFDRNNDKQLTTDEYYFKTKLPVEFFVINEDGSGWEPYFKFPGRQSIGSPAVSPDGKTLAFDSHLKDLSTNTIFVMDIAERKPREICLGMMPTWSKDGKQLAFSQNGIEVIGIDAQNKEQIWAQGWGAQWSPDSKRIAFYSGLEIKAYNVETKQTSVLLPANENPYKQVFWNMAWSPDSSKLCLKGQKADGTFEMAIFDPAATPKLKTRAINKVGMMEDSAWHPNGKRIVIGMYCEERSHMQLYEFDSNTDDPPTLVKGQDPARSNASSCWTPDGKRLILMSHPN